MPEPETQPPAGPEQILVREFLAPSPLPLFLTAEDLPRGDYAIVEILGHRTLVGRVSEAERFGTKLLAVEPLFAPGGSEGCAGGRIMLAPVLIGGGSIYQFTPCTPATAFAKAPVADWQLPEPVRLTIPAALLSAPAFGAQLDEGEDDYATEWEEEDD